MRLSYYKTHPDLLAKAFTSLAEKCYYSGKKTQVVTLNNDYVENLDRVLWSYSKKHFIPHATVNDPHPQLQPILIGESLQVRHLSAILFTVNIAKQTLANIIATVAKHSDSNGKQIIERIILLEDEVAGIGRQTIASTFAKEGSDFSELDGYTQNSRGEWQKL